MYDKTNFPLGTVIASETKVYIKKSRGTHPYDYEEYWMGAEGYAWPIYRDDICNKLIAEEGFKVLRLGKE